MFAARHTQTPAPAAIDRIAEAVAEINRRLPGLKPRAVEAAERELIAVREERARRAEALRALCGTSGKAGTPEGALVAAISQAEAEIEKIDADIGAKKARLAELRAPYSEAATKALGPALAEIDAAIAEAGTILSAAADALRLVERYRGQNGITIDAPRHRRDWRFLASVVAEITP